VWTSGTAPDAADRLATAVTFEGCSDRRVLHLGGLVAVSGQTWLRQTFSGTGEDERLVRRLDGASCG
jgi:hypothetical protein